MCINPTSSPHRSRRQEAVTGINLLGRHRLGDQTLFYQVDFFFFSPLRQKTTLEAVSKAVEIFSSIHKHHLTSTWSMRAEQVTPGGTERWEEPSAGSPGDVGSPDLRAAHARAACIPQRKAQCPPLLTRVPSGETLAFSSHLPWHSVTAPMRITLIV